MQEGLLRRAERFFFVHINYTKSWDKGGIKGVWQETDGTICISYENGQWFHYKEENSQIIWWQGDYREHKEERKKDGNRELQWNGVGAVDPMGG